MHALLILEVLIFGFAHTISTIGQAKNDYGQLSFQASKQASKVDQMVCYTVYRCEQWLG